MDGTRSTGPRAFVPLLMLIVLAAAGSAFAQGQNGILTGIVADGDGVVPGATVTATDPTTGLIRTAVSNDRGTFRVLSVPAGRYTLKIEMEGFRQITLNEVMIISGETRDLGRLVLEVGTLAEAVTVTAEVTPVNTTTGSLQRNMTGDQLTMIQVKGRDIFGMMKILPGVNDTALSRDYAAWQSGRSLSINGATSLNKNTTIDGVPVGEEGGDGTTHITPNIDAIGEVTVITNGYTRKWRHLAACPHRYQIGRISCGVGWYPPGARVECNATSARSRGRETFFEVASRVQHRGPVHSGTPRRRSAKRKCSLLLSEFVDDVRPTAVRGRPATDAERRGDFSQTRVTNGTIQPTSSADWTAFPGNIIPQNRITDGPQC